MPPGLLSLMLQALWWMKLELWGDGGEFRLRASYFPMMESSRRRVKVHSARNTLQAGYSLLHSLAPPSPTLTRFAGLSAGPQCRACGPGPGGAIRKGSLVMNRPARVQTCGSAYFPRPLPLCGGHCSLSASLV